jgi:hypothetical protein
LIAKIGKTTADMVQIVMNGGDEAGLAKRVHRCLGKAQSVGTRGRVYALSRWPGASA